MRTFRPKIVIFPKNVIQKVFPQAPGKSPPRPPATVIGDFSHGGHLPGNFSHGGKLPSPPPPPPYRDDFPGSSMVRIFGPAGLKNPFFGVPAELFVI